ncbi:hypothetical protein ACEYW6_18310, partial [Nostoc sp. UIC 10607]
MARRKRTSQVLEKAARRAAGINSIDPNLNVGNGLTLPIGERLEGLHFCQEGAGKGDKSSLET